MINKILRLRRNIAIAIKENFYRRLLSVLIYSLLMISARIDQPTPLLPRNSIGVLLHETARLLRRRFEQKSRDLGLTRSQWQVLVYLSRQQGARQSALAEQIDVEPITLGRIIDRLEAAALVERRNDPGDRRVWRLYLTERANPLLAELAPIVEAAREEALAGLSESDRAILIRALETIRVNLGSTHGADTTNSDRSAKNDG